MGYSSICLFIFFALFLGHVFVKLEASQHVYRTLQTCQYFSSSITSQPYRTGYHFQPPSSWMNGKSFFISVLSRFEFLIFTSLLVSLTFVWSHVLIMAWTNGCVCICRSQRLVLLCFSGSCCCHFVLVYMFHPNLVEK